MNLFLVVLGYSKNHYLFSWIWTEYRFYSVWMREDTDQKISEYGHFTRNDYLEESMLIHYTASSPFIWKYNKYWKALERRQTLVKSC